MVAMIEPLKGDLMNQEFFDLIKREIRSAYKAGRAFRPGIKALKKKAVVMDAMSRIGLAMAGRIRVPQDQPAEPEPSRRVAPWGRGNVNELTQEEIDAFGAESERAVEADILAINMADQAEPQPKKIPGIGMATRATLEGPPIYLTQEGRCIMDCRAERMAKGLPPVWEGKNKYKRGIACGLCAKVFKKEELAAVIPEIPAECKEPNVDELVKAEIVDAKAAELAAEQAADLAADEVFGGELPSTIYHEPALRQDDDEDEDEDDINDHLVFQCLQTFAEESGQSIATLKALDLTEPNLVRMATESTDPHRKMLAKKILGIRSGGSWAPPPPPEKNSKGELFVYCQVEGCERRSPERHLKAGNPSALRSKPCEGKIGCMFGIAQAQIDDQAEAARHAAKMARIDQEELEEKYSVETCDDCGQDLAYCECNEDEISVFGPRPAS